MVIMILTIDTGGTKTLLALFTKEGKITEQFKFPTPKDKNEYLKELVKNVSEFAKGKDISIISLGSPGYLRDGVIVWSGGNLNWENVDVKSAINKAFPNIPFIAENDANLAGLSEARLLKPTPGQVLYVTISTGIGTAIITNGKIDPSLRDSEGGHMPIEYDGAVRRWETFASGKAIYNAYGKYARDIKNKRHWYDIADRISRGFLAIIPMLQPDTIVIGGSIGTYFDRYNKELTGILKEKLIKSIPVPNFVQAQNPEEAVIYGAYHNGVDALSSEK